MFTPLGYIDGSLSIIENFGIEDGGDRNTNWFGDFKEKYLVGKMKLEWTPTLSRSSAIAIEDAIKSVEERCLPTGDLK